MGRDRAGVLAGLVATACFCAASAASARTMVLSARGPSAASFPAGKTLVDPLNIVLKAGDRLTLLDGSGTTILKGPTTVKGKVSAALSLEDYAIVNALTQARPKRQRAAGVSFMLDAPTGATTPNTKGFSITKTGAATSPSPPRTGSTVSRTGIGEKAPVATASAPRPAKTAPVKILRPIVPRTEAVRPGLWDVDPALGADWCVEGDSNVSIYRSAATATLELTVATDGGKLLPTIWPAGAYQLALPAGWAGDNSGLTIQWRVAGTATSASSSRNCPLFGDCDAEWQSFPLTIHRIGGAPDSVPKLAIALDAAGCDVQLSRLEAIYRTTPAAP